MLERLEDLDPLEDFSRRLRLLEETASGLDRQRPSFPNQPSNLVAGTTERPALLEVAQAVNRMAELSDGEVERVHESFDVSTARLDPEPLNEGGGRVDQPQDLAEAAGELLDSLAGDWRDKRGVQRDGRSTCRNLPFLGEGSDARVTPGCALRTIHEVSELVSSMSDERSVLLDQLEKVGRSVAHASMVPLLCDDGVAIHQTLSGATS